jgi:hypothetical protein
LRAFTRVIIDSAAAAAILTDAITLMPFHFFELLIIAFD